MVNDIKKKYSGRAFFLSVILGLCFILMGEKSVCRGVILGSIFSVVNFFLLSRTLRSRIEKSKDVAVPLVMTNIAVRYLFMALPLFLSLKFDRFSIFGVAIGLFTVQLTILFDHLPRFFFPPR